MTTYYAVCNAGGPISVRLHGDDEAAALAAFSALDGRAVIDRAATDAEDALGIVGADSMDESEFGAALEAAGAAYVRDLDVVVNAHAGTVAHLAGGWSLWAVAGEVR